MTDLASGPPATRPVAAATTPRERRDGRIDLTPTVLTDILEWSARVRQPYEELWQTCWDWYRGATNDYAYAYVRDSRSGAATRVSINMIKPIVDTLIAATSTRSPKFALVPRSSRAARNALRTESVLNYYWRSRRMADAFTPAQVSNVITGHGWLKVNWSLDLTTRTPTAAERNSRFEARRIEVQHFRDMNPAVADDMISDEELRRIVNEEIDAEPPILVSHAEYPLTMPVSIFDMYVDPKATRPDDADWFCQRTIMHRDQILSNRNYGRKARSEVRKGAGAIQSAAAAYSLIAPSDDRKGRSYRAQQANDVSQPHTYLVETFEFHDLREGTWCRFVPDADAFLTTPRDSPYKDTPHRSPFEMLRNHEIVDFYPQGDVEQLISANWQLNETYTLLLSHLRGMARKYRMREGDMTPQTRQQIQSDEPNTIVTVGGNHPLNETLSELPASDPPFQLYNLLTLTTEHIKQISGVSDLQLGTAEVERRSAAEANLLGEAGSSRVAKKIHDSQQAAARIGARIILLAQLYLTKEDIVRITDAQGAESWETFDRSRILGQFDYDVEHGSMMPRNDAARRQDTLAMIQALSQLPVLAQTPVDVTKLAEMILRNFGVPNTEDFIQDRQAQLGDAQAALSAQQPGQQPAPTGVSNAIV